MSNYSYQTMRMLNTLAERGGRLTKKWKEEGAQWKVAGYYDTEKVVSDVVVDYLFQEGYMQLDPDGNEDVFRAILTAAGKTPGFENKILALKDEDFAPPAARPILIEYNDGSSETVDQSGNAIEIPAPLERTATALDAISKILDGVFKPSKKVSGKEQEKRYGIRPIYISYEDIIGAASRLAASTDDPRGWDEADYCVAVEHFLRRGVNEILSNPALYMQDAPPPLDTKLVEFPTTCEVASCGDAPQPGSRFCEGHAALLADPAWTAQPLVDFDYEATGATVPE